MPLAQSATHPVALQNPVTVRAWAALPAAGAWDAAPTELACAGFNWVTLYLAYLGDVQGAGGAFDVALWASPYEVDASASAAGRAWFQASLYAAGVMAAGTDIQSRDQREYVTYVAVAAATELFVYGPIQLIDGVERIRIPARESADGDTDNPGELEIIGVFTTGV